MNVVPAGDRPYPFTMRERRRLRERFKRLEPITHPDTPSRNPTPPPTDVCVSTSCIEGAAERAVARHRLLWSQCDAARWLYVAARTNGNDSDSPAWPLPPLTEDDCLHGQWGSTYYAPPAVITWFEEKDRNYILRLAREGRLLEVEPHADTEISPDHKYHDEICKALQKTRGVPGGWFGSWLLPGAAAGEIQVEVMPTSFAMISFWPETQTLAADTFKTLPLPEASDDQTEEENEQGKVTVPIYSSVGDVITSIPGNLALAACLIHAAQSAWSWLTTPSTPIHYLKPEDFEGSMQYCKEKLKQIENKVKTFEKTIKKRYRSCGDDVHTYAAKELESLQLRYEEIMDDFKDLQSRGRATARQMYDLQGDVNYFCDKAFTESHEDIRYFANHPRKENVRDFSSASFVGNYGSLFYQPNSHADVCLPEGVVIQELECPQHYPAP